ncbi:MAG: DEAD/DEAH box helicase [Caldilineaceae bacterium]|nr:DEAD/DEAH box helicase [Caldilineaceae bacterium]
MPIPFEDLSERDGADSVAWLRFVDEEGGQGIRAALFETSTFGEPLSFSFARTDRRGPAPSFAEPADRRDAAVFSLAKNLIQSATGTPAVLFGLADEIPLWVVTDGLRLGLPFCRIILGGESGPQLLWATEPPGEGSRAELMFDSVMRRDDPFEAFARAAQCLSRAYAYRQIHGIASFAGLNAVINLSRPAAEDGSGRSAAAERLWELLALPSEDGTDIQSSLPAPWISQMEWPGALMPFQVEGVRALLEMDRLLLADDMGLGKTVQTVAALRILRARGEARSCMVVAPASVLNQWRQEIGKWAPELSAIIVRGPAAERSWQWTASKDVTLVSYEALRQDADRVPAVSSDGVWDVVVADEAQRIKNRNDTSEAVKSVPRVRSWALTGTPIENREEELASIMEFVDHDRMNPGKRYFPGMELLNRHKEVQLRRKKSEVLDDLPPKLETKLTVALDRRQAASYTKAEDEGIVYLKSLGGEVRIRHILELITRLKQICNFDPVTGESSKLDDIRERLEQLTEQGHKALVFSQYASDVFGVKAAASYLRAFNPVVLTGETPLEERPGAIERFKSCEEHKVMVISLRAGGLGLNLQEASYVFHLDRWWNPAVERQAEDRAHRVGQTAKVNVIKYACAGTIEERIDRILERKQRLFDQLIDDVSLDLSARLSGEELFALFGMEPPSVDVS